MFIDDGFADAWKLLEFELKDQKFGLFDERHVRKGGGGRKVTDKFPQFE